MANVTFDEFSRSSKILAYIAYAVQCSYYRTLQATSEKLFFGSDMLLDIHFEPNYKEIWLRNQNIISYNNKRENAKQVEYDYAVGHYAYILRDKNYRKLEGERLGPFRITQVHTNGYFRIQRGIINAQINTRRLTHHFGDPPS